ncbi:MAG: 50S ribosomal protein L17 [Deltaproteobacteria bacterium]|jgi:large subunit ribosomal protein L17|nr:MAG: 50S ribosomal protein L17 [Deltaproteobacteria bacterium]
MRHRKAGKKLGRDSGHRKAILRNLVTSLFRHEEVSTTYAKAKVLCPIAEKMITLAKKGDLHARRQALSYIMDKSVTHKLFDQMKDRFSGRQGGYIRILKTGHRTGDNAPLVIIQLLLADEEESSRKTIKKRPSGEREATNEVSGKKADSKGKTRASEDKQEKVEKP